MVEKVLEVTNLKKSFGKNLIFENINISINKGEILSICGESGAGKTTLLRCITALEKPDAGQIKICDNVLFDSEKNYFAKSKELSNIIDNLGMVFQNFNLFPHMTVMENIILSPVKKKLMTKEQAKEEARKILKKLNLEDKENMYPYQLSGGQKQRIAIARATILNPAIMCFDEPTSALDDKNTDGIKEIIKNLAQNGMAILIISHDKQFVKDLTENILYL